MTTIIWVFAAACFGTLLFRAIAAGQCWWYRFRTYPRLRTQMDSSFRPKVRVFLPCKGAEPGMDANLDALATQDYPDFKLVCVTESAEDSAVPQIEAAERRHPGRFERVVAGLTTHCGQKNHNLLAAIDAHGDSEVYLFCDAKVRPNPDWIARMVEPFSLAGRPILGVTAMCSGGRFSDWRLPHMFQQQVATWQSIALTSFISGIWGASMAIRRRDFEELGLREIWAETIVDDVTTFSRLLREGKGTMFPALDAYPNAAYSMRTFGQAFDWGVRQTLYVRYCLPQYWVPMLLQNVLGIASLCWPQVFLTDPGTAGHLFGLVCLGFSVPAAFINLVMKPAAGVEIPWPRYLLLALFWDILWILLSVSVSQEDGVAWRGVQYDLDRYGRVLSITRDELEPGIVGAGDAEEPASGKTAKVTA